MCAICDNTNATTQLCPSCYADPANAGWGETWEVVDEFIADKAVSAKSLAELSDRKLRNPSELRAQILDLATRGFYCRMQVFDARGHSRGRRWGYLALTYRDIAFLVGCSHVHVMRVVQNQLK